MSTVPQVELVNIKKQFGSTVTADNFSLTINKGEFFTFLGPSGSGKSTILRMVAGLEHPDSGRILFGGRDLVGVPPWKRNLGMMFQQYAIFPHMTVAQNVAYGLKARSMPASAQRARVDEMLELIGMTGKGGKNATLLSGGEQQRVALARALAPSPEMLLLDEPLSALDEKIRREMQLELKHIQRRTGTTFFYVTHDQEEALTMSDRVAVLNGGQCVQCDVPEIIFTRPRTRFVARFFRGCNVVDATFDNTGPHAVVSVGGASLPVAHPARSDRGKTLGLAIRCEDLHVGEKASGFPMQLSATLEELIYKGTTVDHCLRLADGQRVVATSTRREVDMPGQVVPVGLDPSRVVFLED
jgi:ABC-type Fe3+/spermidine/putrescine transport system ATPase subunit